MATTEAAARNHDQLFPGRASTLKQTDPELVEYFDNFALGEVLAHGDLDIRTRLMVQLAALIACQAQSQYRIILDAALTNGVTPVEAKEIVYQAVAYVGMGKAFDFVNITNQVLTDRGVELPLPGQSTTTPETRADFGLAVQKRIFGADLIDQLYAAAPGRRAAHPALSVGQLLRRPLHPRRARPANQGTPHVRDAGRPRRLRSPGTRDTSQPTSTSATADSC